MSRFRKLRNNLLSGTPVSVLGPLQYARYLASYLVCAKAIRRDGNLRSVDRIMGRSVRTFHYRRSSFFFDCRFADDQLPEVSLAFGLARELYIRDCYFRWHPRGVFEEARTVIDLGANRGAFASLMTTRAKFILTVECRDHYALAIQHNMQLNGFSNYAMETAFVGSGGADDQSRSPRLTVDELIQRHRLDSVDLLKIDIEGSEFALFESAGWLERVKAISMEVHSQYGDPRRIVRRMSEHGFAYALAGEDLERVPDVEDASFIYAWKSSGDRGDR